MPYLIRVEHMGEFCWLSSRPGQHFPNLVVYDIVCDEGNAHQFATRKVAENVAAVNRLLDAEVVVTGEDKEREAREAAERRAREDADDGVSR